MSLMSIQEQLKLAGLEVLGVCDELSSHAPKWKHEAALLEDLTPAEADELGKLMPLVRAQPGQALIREGDVGAILGWGFAPWSGGPFSWLDILSAPRAVEICDALTAQFGARFAAPALLQDMAAKGETFYTRFATEKAA